MSRKKVKESFKSGVFESKLYKEFENELKNSECEATGQLENSSFGKAELKNKNQKNKKKERSNKTRMIAPKKYAKQRKSKKAWNLIKLPRKNYKIRFARPSFMHDKEKISNTGNIEENNSADCETIKESVDIINNHSIIEKNGDTITIEEKNDDTITIVEKSSSFITEENGNYSITEENDETISIEEKNNNAIDTDNNAIDTDNNAIDTNNNVIDTDNNAIDIENNTNDIDETSPILNTNYIYKKNENPVQPIIKDNPIHIEKYNKEESEKCNFEIPDFSFEQNCQENTLFDDVLRKNSDECNSIDFIDFIDNEESYTTLTDDKEYLCNQDNTRNAGLREIATEKSVSSLDNAIEEINEKALPTKEPVSCLNSIIEHSDRNNSTSSSNSSLLESVSDNSNISNDINNDNVVADIEQEHSLSFGSFNESEQASSYLNVENEEKTIKSSENNTALLEDSNSIEFPSDETNNLSIGSTDWHLLEPIVSFVISSCNLHLSNKKIAVLQESPQKLISKKEITDESVYFDQRYHYFLKKVCNLSKKECIIYGKEHYKLLLERSYKNKAKIANRKKYYAIEEENGTGINVFFLESNLKKGDLSDLNLQNEKPAGMNSVYLKKVQKIKNLTIPSYEKENFEYLVYKHGDSLELISKKTNLDIKDVILIYYLRYHNVFIEISGPLLDKYVSEEWNMNDRILFEENFTKYGTKFTKYMMSKHETELRIYYKYYLKHYLPMNWSDEERVLFAHLINIYKKDWNAMASCFQNGSKNANDLRVYYSSYYKKLDEEERLRELQLVDVCLPKSEVIHRKRGRKPNSLKIATEKADE